MSVLIMTSIGDIVVDLYTKDCPKACLNFLKLCKIKYYNNCLFYDVQKDFIAQSGDPENKGKEGNSIYGIIKGEKYRYFDDEIIPQFRHNKLGILACANKGPNLNTSTFYIQLCDKSMPYLNDKHTIFGSVEEGLETLDKLNKVYVDKDNRPYQNIRIKHTVVLDDPFDDPDGLIEPSKSPEAVRDVEYNRLEDDFKIDEFYKDQATEEKVKEKLQEHEAKNRAIVLEMLEDIPDADIKPPENVLFICKLNPVTQDDDLEVIFSRFGPIKSCQIIRDWKTGQSLQYAFIEFEKVEDCEQAYFKMNGVVIDERRIKVDFSQSVAKYWYNVKKNKESLALADHDQNKPSQLVMPNENMVLEIKADKDLMPENKNFKLVFDQKNNEDIIHSMNRTKSRERSRKKEIKIEKKTDKQKRHSRSKSMSKSSSSRSKSSGHKHRHRHHYQRHRK